MKDFSKYEDSQLVALIASDNSYANSAFNVLYFRYCDKLNSYCLFITDSREDAEDLHQETWLKFHKMALAGKNDVRLPIYLYTIARSLNIDKYRVKKNSFVAYSDIIDFNQIPDIFNLQYSIDNKDLMNLVAMALYNLKAIYRETFVLKWFSGLTNPEIAQITGETVDCIKQRSSRAMDEVLKILKPVINEVKERG